MSSKRQVNKGIREILTVLLTLGVVSFVGFLSFTGALLLYSSLIFACVAVVLSAGVEGLVYERNIKQALKKILKKNYFEDAVLKNELKLLLKKGTDKHNTFISDYKKQYKYLARLKNSHAEACDIHEAKKSLKKMRAHFKDFIKNPQKALGEFDSSLNKIISEKERLAILSNIWWKKTYARLVWGINIAVGLCSSLVGISVVKSGITTLLTIIPIVVPATALSATVFGLAILGAAGYVFLIHNTLTDMIKNDTLLSWKNKLTNLMTYRQGEKPYYRALRIGGVLLLAAVVVGFGVFTTLATAGTWWYAAKIGAHAIPYLKEAATWIRNITVPIMGITNLLFVVNNSFASVKDISNFSIKAIGNNIKKSFSDTCKEENILQVINPFRVAILLISVPFKCVMFIGHLVSMGVMADKLGNIPVAVTTGVNSVTEGLTDLHPLLPEKSGHHHHHADIPTFILNVALSPLYLLGALWDSLFSVCNFSRPRNTPWQALKKMVGGSHHSPCKTKLEKPNISGSWILYERKLKWQKENKKTAVNAGTKLENDREVKNKKCRRTFEFFPENCSSDSAALELAPMKLTRKRR